MSYPSFPFPPGFGGLLITFDPSHMLFPGGAVAAIIGTVTVAAPISVSGGAQIFRPGIAGQDVMQSTLGTWIDPPGAGISSAVLYPLRWGLLRGFIALSPGGAS